MSVDMFLKIDGIPGDSVAEKHKGWIDVLSFSWGATLPVSQTGTGGGGTTGKVQVQDFSFVKGPDKATPEFLQSVCSGEHIKEATFAVTNDNQQEFLKIKMTDVLISSYQTGGSAGMLPAEQVSFSFQKIELSVAPQNADGTVGAFVSHSCDLKANTSA